MSFVVFFLSVGLLSSVGLLVWQRLRSIRSAADLERLKTASSSDRAELRAILEREGRRDDFISTVSHELRTPLTSIRASLGLLSSGSLGTIDEQARRLLRIASSNTDRLVRLLDDMLDLATMDAGTTSLSLKVCSIGELIEFAIETMVPLASPAGVTIRSETDTAKGSDYIYADPDRILQVVCNLLSNAIKFAPRDSTVFVKVSFGPERVVVRVIDHGRGVPVEKLETIFERFSQVYTTDRSQHNGTGLGLAICRSIVLLHGGTICAERNDTSLAGELGSTFIVDLPLMLGASSHLKQS